MMHREVKYRAQGHTAHKKAELGFKLRDWLPGPALSHYSLFPLKKVTSLYLTPLP